MSLCIAPDVLSYNSYAVAICKLPKQHTHNRNPPTTFQFQCQSRIVVNCQPLNIPGLALGTMTAIRNAVQKVQSYLHYGILFNILGHQIFYPELSIAFHAVKHATICSQQLRQNTFV